ncbi:MAG: hypothetical protein ACTTJ9_10450 [Segatella oris]|uniref:hypothetical protein n=1 Tax=Segatella oris TaxID=28135 RepID=UPI003FA1EDFF
MKKLLSLIFILSFVMTGKAQSFTAPTVDGVSLRYRVSDAAKHQVIVEEYQYLGTIPRLEIPAQVQYNGTTYDVIELAGFAFKGCTINEVILNEGLQAMDYSFWHMTLGNAEIVIPSTVTSINSSFDLTFWVHPKISFRLLNPIPAANSGLGVLSTILEKIVVPADATYAYENSTAPSVGGGAWSDHIGKYREEVNIGTTGYTTYYLENENFLIPAGCTAYIITGVTPSGSITTPDQAVVKAFTAGKIIPKKTGFILQGTPNSTVVYQANVTGPEEDVTGNLLVGTAVEQEISGAGHKFYVLANGDQGLGFYKQGTRGGTSIKLKPHRAGLRLDESIGRAKSLIFDFDAARREAETTGIRSVRPEIQRRDNAVYDLQGRRVINPTHGIYIINGKKIIK